MKTLKLDVTDLRVDSWRTDESAARDFAIPTTTVLTKYVTCTCPL